MSKRIITSEPEPHMHFPPAVWGCGGAEAYVPGQGSFGVLELPMPIDHVCRKFILGIVISRDIN